MAIHISSGTQLLKHFEDDFVYVRPEVKTINGVTNREIKLWSSLQKTLTPCMEIVANASVGQLVQLLQSRVHEAFINDLQQPLTDKSHETLSKIIASLAAVRTSIAHAPESEETRPLLSPESFVFSDMKEKDVEIVLDNGTVDSLVPQLEKTCFKERAFTRNQFLQILKRPDSATHRSRVLSARRGTQRELIAHYMGTILNNTLHVLTVAMKPQYVASGVPEAIATDLVAYLVPTTTTQALCRRGITDEIDANHP